MKFLRWMNCPTSSRPPARWRRPSPRWLPVGRVTPRPPPAGSRPAVPLQPAPAETVAAHLVATDPAPADPTSPDAADPTGADAVEAADAAEIWAADVEDGEPGRAEPDEANRPPLATLVEAVLMVAEKPVGVAELATGLSAPALDVERVLAELSAQYRRDGRGFDLRHVGGGWRFYTAEECAPWVEKFVLAGQMSRLSQAALE